LLADWLIVGAGKARQRQHARSEDDEFAHGCSSAVTVKDTRAGDERTPGPERPAGNEFVATPQAGMYRYFLSILIHRGALRSTLIAS
jgi:hypothetical protein